MCECEECEDECASVRSVRMSVQVCKCEDECEDKCEDECEDECASVTMVLQRMR